MNILKNFDEFKKYCSNRWENSQQLTYYCHKQITDCNEKVCPFINHVEGYRLIPEDEIKESNSRNRCSDVEQLKSPTGLKELLEKEYGKGNETKESNICNIGHVD
jgi:hypothetical protein